ncbi:MAG: MoaD/ThiS family protein [Candidatus Micrarchaeota archaeon]
MKLSIDNKTKSVKFSGTVSNILKKEKIRREEVIIKVNGKLVPETAKVTDRDKVEIITVVFGG